jgi:hypothetical protein
MSSTGEPARAPISLAMKDGRVLSFSVGVRLQRKAAFVLSLRKSGSSLFSNLVGAISQFNRVPVVDIPGTMFDNGYRYADWNGHPNLRDLLWKGNTYVGFRDPPTAFYGDPVFEQAPKLLLVRDPRDVLVSEYFSNAFSHSLPRAEAERSVLAQERRRALQSSVEDYVMSRVSALNQTVDGYRRLLGVQNLKVIRYEDVIFDKPGWCRTIAEHFGMEAPDRLIEGIMGWADVVPDTENPTAFVRRVTPGDHLDKLAPPAIERVNKRLNDIWRKFGYELPTH